MGLKTGIIKYNVRERGRRHRGRDRNFDTAQLAKIINGPVVQEMVKNRDLLGYYGHWPRIQFGMNPTEGAVVQGRAVALEPALVTTFLKAHPDGTIEHEAELLDTTPGKIAQRLFSSKVGGFSSAIDVKNIGETQVPLGFYGFDYVMEPNYTTNRPYALDGVEVAEEEFAVLDAVSEYNALLDSTNRMLDSMQAAYDMQAAAYQRVVEENEVLMGMLAKAKRGERPEVALDSLISVVHGNKFSRFDSADDFLRENLAGREEPPKAVEPASEADKHLSRRFGL